MTTTPIYTLRVADVYRQLETSPDGLSSDEVLTRQNLYGKNLLSESAKPRLLSRFLKLLRNPSAILLLCAGILALILQEPLLCIFIFSLVLINAGFSFWREYSAERAIQALSQLLPDQTRVVRSGIEILIPAFELVPGDILVLEEGDNIPADARIIEEFGLRINHATLTGESVPARKTADASLVEGISEIERPNLIFAGTSVVSGTTRAVVFATGMLTQFGRLAHLTETARIDVSPLQRELERFIGRLQWFAIGMGVLVFIISILDLGMQWQESMALSIGMLVAIIPEGLPATTTLTLAMSAQRLAQRGVLVKKLSNIELLGNVSIICTDKSGTLTQNQMTVREIWQAGKVYSISGAGYEPAGKIMPTPTSASIQDDLTALLVAAVLCNNSRLVPPSAEHRRWTSLGDGTEAALRVAAIKGGIDEKEILTSLPRIHELPFDARRKRMSTIHRKNNESRKRNGNGHSSNWLRLFPAHNGQPVREVTFTKGAPREVLQLCTHVLMGGKLVPLDGGLRQQILSANDTYARNALRVLALAYRVLPNVSDKTTENGMKNPAIPVGNLYNPDRIERELVFLGLVGMMDPPRPEVSDAVQVLRRAHIRMVMITGDYGLTAESIARRIGMLTTPNPLIITGAELEEMDDEGLKNLLKEEVIFARMAPEHKLRLVATFQELGEVVAVTGDGVNDAPALRKADIGIAMGVIGTDVAKEAADVIITNDDFSAILRAIEEGRSVFSNLRKFMTYIFSSNLPELMPFLLTALFRIPLALRVQQILAIDLGTDLLPALALGTERPEPGVMDSPPRSRTMPLVDRSLLKRAIWLGLIETILCYIAFFFVYHWFGNMNLLTLTTQEWRNIPELMSKVPMTVTLMAVTVFHAGVVMAQVGNAFACRTEKARNRQQGWFSNPRLWGGVAVEILIILMMIYIPPLAKIMDHVPLPWIFWPFLAMFGPILYLLEWSRKEIIRKHGIKKQQHKMIKEVIR
jgi:Ca2+-transporting ATPase